MAKPDQFRLVAPSEHPDLPPEADAAAARVVEAYRLTMEEADGFPDWRPEGLWAPSDAHAHTQLAATLDRGDPGEAAAALEGMFASPATVGLSMAGELDYLTTSEKSNFYLDWWISGLADLAVYFALLGEQAETGKVEFDLSMVGPLLAAVEERLGVEVRFPRVCNAWGVEFEGKLVPRTVWRNLYSAAVLHRETERAEAPRIVEVGAGFGGVAYWLQQLRPETAYHIFDIPLVAAISGYFLLRALPLGRVSLHGESYAPVRVLPCWLIESEASADVVFNQDSLPEMPERVARRYLAAFDRIGRCFYSDNQERAVQHDGVTPQIRLPDLEDEFERLKPAVRHRSWMRRGYVETFYRSTAMVDVTGFGTAKRELVAA